MATMDLSPGAHPGDAELADPDEETAAHLDGCERCRRLLTECHSRGLIGRRLGDVLVTARLGEGGMCEVYRAVQLELERPVAVKVLKAQHAEDAVEVRRLLAEAKTLSTLKHPRLVPVFASGRLDDGRPYFVMELVKGRTLLELMPLTIDQGRELLGQLLEALEQAHRQGVIHRDVKPGNVLVTQTASGLEARLIDFGIARTTAPGAQATPQTFGSRVGSAAYMAPEQARGEPVSFATDLYALGATIFEAVTGRLYARTESLEPLGPLAGFTARLLQERPEDRFASTSAARDALVALSRATDEVPAARAQLPLWGWVALGVSLSLVVLLAAWLSRS